MSEKPELLMKLQEQANVAEELHARSRQLLRDAVREGLREGLSQREIAVAIGRSQPEVSRLMHFHGTSPLGRKLRENLRSVFEIAASHGMKNLRVFGSVASEADTADSDIDLLVTVQPGTSLFELARAEAELSELLGVPVDIVPDNTLRRNVAERVLGEAVAL